MKQLVRVIIIHGYGGGPGKNWFPWLAAQLDKHGIEASVPAMPIPEAPKLDEWLDYLADVIGQPDENTYLVGHSLGCPTILRYLEQLPKDESVGGTVLVAGFAQPLPKIPEIDGFTTGPWDDAAIRRSAGRIVEIHSNDDPSVPVEMGNRLQERLGAGLVRLDGLGHLNDSTGVTEAPFVLDVLQGMIKF